MVKIKKSNKKVKILAITLFIMLCMIIAGFVIYVQDYYRADSVAISSFLSEDNQWEEDPNGTIIFKPENATKAFIFYPGGKVEYTAYIPLMKALSDNGIMTILVKMPFNLAVFDINIASNIRKNHKDITEWYIGGHSLGGSMAATHLKNNIDSYKGLILLGSYSTADISETEAEADIDVLSIYGSLDKVLNREKYELNKENLPKNFTELIIDGGNHAYFGMYGAQNGDGTPTISNEEQIKVTVEAIVKMINE